MEKYKPGEITVQQKWTRFAMKKLLGRKVAQVRYLTLEEQQDMGWLNNPLVIIFDDGSFIFPMADDEGNNAGALAGGLGDDLYTFPVLATAV